MLVDVIIVFFFSSAPKIYSGQPTVNKDDSEKSQKKSSDSGAQDAKRRKKNDAPKTSDDETGRLTHAQEMAAKVRESETTVTVPMENPVPTPNITSFSATGGVGASAAPNTSGNEKKREKKAKKNLRYAGGQVWEDQSLNEWDSGNYLPIRVPHPKLLILGFVFRIFFFQNINLF